MKYLSVGPLWSSIYVIGCQLDVIVNGMHVAGLDYDKDHIIEIAVLITDGELSSPHLEVSNISYV